MKIIYLGTPEFAIKPLEALLVDGHELLAVVTQPDKPQGRRQILTPPPLKSYALSRGLKVLQYKKIRTDGIEELKRLNPDIMITAAYGQILSQEIIDIPKYGILNIHGSILPKYRGAMPVQWAIIEGEKSTGVTIMQTDAGIDSGGILLFEEISISEDATGGEILEALSEMGARLIVQAIKDVENGLKAVPQEEEKATYYPIIKKEDCKIDFSKSAERISNLIRALNPSSVAYFTLNGKHLKVYKSKVSKGVFREFSPSQIVKADKGGFIIKCGEGALELIEIQEAGGSRMNASSYLNGRKVSVGMRTE